MTSLLFVDDEPLVLDGLKRMLRSQRNEWQMDFATSGAEALAIMDGKRFDVVVSDMRMPGMDGAEFLNHVAHRFPGTVRIVLSGQAEKDRVLRLLGGCHQYLSKPCEPDILKSTVAQACRLRDRLPNDPLKQAIANVNVIASDPQLYSQLVDELLKDDPSLTQLGHIVEQDIGMTAKVMQLVSTNFFGQPRRVRSAAEAVESLGVDLMGELLHTGRAFGPFDASRVPGFDIAERNRHAWEVGECARRIMAQESDDPILLADTFLAGMLYDVGQIVLADQFPDEYVKALHTAQEHNLPLWQAEADTFNAGHSDIGSFLMGLWGLPENIVETICQFRSPEDNASGHAMPLSAVSRAEQLWACLINVGDA